MQIDTAVANFARAQNGGAAVALSFALALVVGSAGVAIDYVRLDSAKTHVQAAADSAALAAAAKVSEGHPETAESAFSSFLDENVDRSMLHGAAMKPAYTLSGGNRVVAAVSASIDSSLMSLFGFSELPFTVHAEAEVGGTYADIHILIDTTGSMNIPDSKAGVDKLVSVFKPDGSGGCSFACHGTGNSGYGLYNGRTGFSYAEEYGIYLREDRLRDSLLAMIDKIAAAPAAANIRVSLDIISGTIPKPIAKNVDLAAAREAILAVPFRVNTASISKVLGSYASAFPRPGKGTMADPAQYAVIITDGVSHQPATDKPESLGIEGCEKLKAMGVQPYVLNITYPDVSYVIGDKAKLNRFWGAIQSAPDALSSCAGKGSYFDAYEGQEISDALAEIADRLAPRKTATLVK